jgi:DNA-binding transcriptional ArsR family regulator
MKSAKQLERYFKGAADHHRIEILRLINKCDGLTLENISERLNVLDKTISAHTSKLVQAGLLNKKYRGRQVLHSLSSYGEKFIKFMETF